MTDISLHGSYGDPRAQAQRANQLSMAHLRVAGQRPAASANPHAGAVPWSPEGPVPFGWHGTDWQHGRSPEETARLRDRFEQFVPRIAGMSGPGRAQEFFADMLPPGAALAPNAGAGYRQAVQHHYDLRKRAGVGGRQGGPYNLPYGGTIGGGGSWGGGAGGVIQQTQRPYQPEFECLTYSTPITMIDGSQLPAGEAARGDSVLGSDGRVYEIKRQAPAGVPEELIDLETWGGEKFTVTTNHRWPAFIWARECHCGCGEEVKQGRIYKQNHRKKDAGPGEATHKHGCDKHTSPSYKAIPKGYAPVQLVESADLRPGDCLLMPRKFGPIETNVIEDQARLLGYWIAEGSVDRGPLGDYGACFNFGAHEERTWAADAAELLRLEGLDTTTSVHTDKGRCRVRTTNDCGRKRAETDHTVRWLIDNGGEGAGEKRLSETVMRWPVKLKRALLVGMIRGGGSQFYATTKEGDSSRSFTVTYTTASPVLARQTALILAQCGFPARVVPVREPRNCNGWNYRVDVKGGDYPRDLADMVWGEASLSKEHDKSNDVGHACMMDDDFVYVPIKKVTRRPNVEREAVYTIAVSAEDQLYCLGAGLSLLTKNSPDRQNYPIHRNLANTYWRLFYKLDALIGNGVDMYAELPWGDFELVGEGVDGEPKKAFERMCEVCNLRSILPYFVKEYLVVGEACPHLFYDDDEGIWTYIGMHNPDQLEVIYTPFIKMDPVVRFKPDHRLQQVLSSTSEMVRAVRETMPPELLSALLSGQYIELSPTNFTFLPRKMHPYDVRGTSILSRMWRPLMYEDAIFNASIATARRHAGPIKVAKLGDRTTGWIPDPSHEQRLLELLAQAELDPHAWLIYHYGIEFDMVGTTDRVMTIDKHWDLIERIKLIAMGISKAFLHGEVTYASAASGLTVFLQRLKNLRQFFENAWIYPKFFRPVAEMNEWVKPTAAEAASASPKGPYIKTRRSRRELIEDDRYIVPTLEWDRQLDPSVESAQITAVQALQGMGVIFSKQYLSSLVGRDWEEEINQRAREAKIEQQILANNPGLQAAMTPAGPGGPGGGMPGGPPPGGGGADIMPGLPPEVMGFETEPGAEGPGGGGGAPGAPGAGEAGVHAAPGESGAPSGAPSGGGFWAQPQMWSRDGQHGGWDESVVQDLVRVIRDSEDPEEDLWVDMLKETPELKSYLGDPDLSWELVDDWLHRADVGYPPAEILTLEDILKRQGVLAGGEVLIAPKAGRKPRRKGYRIPSDKLLVGVK